MDVHNEGRSLKEKIKDKKLLLEFEETWDYVDDKLADILLTLPKLENIVAKTNIELVDKKSICYPRSPLKTVYIGLVGEHVTFLYIQQDKSSY